MISTNNTAGLKEQETLLHRRELAAEIALVEKKEGVEHGKTSFCYYHIQADGQRGNLYRLFAGKTTRI